MKADDSDFLSDADGLDLSAVLATSQRAFHTT